MRHLISIKIGTLSHILGQPSAPPNQYKAILCTTTKVCVVTELHCEPWFVCTLWTTEILYYVPLCTSKNRRFQRHDSQSDIIKNVTAYSSFNLNVRKGNYLIKSSTPVSVAFRLIPFHDFFRRNICLALRGSLGSVGEGSAGSGNLSSDTGLSLCLRSPHIFARILFRNPII